MARLDLLPRGGKSSNAAALDRATRQSWINGQLQVRQREREKEQELQRLAQQDNHQRLWSPYMREAARTQELNVAWKHDLGFFSWQRVWGLQDLLALRITGHALGTLPDALASSLPQLETLSLIANQLQSLPENVGRPNQCFSLNNQQSN